MPAGDGTLRFVRPSKEMAASFCAMRDAHVANGEDEWTGPEVIAHSDPEAYIELLRGWSDGVDLPDLWTPADVYWVLLDGVVVAHCDIRHPLTPKLERFGGHIGYHVHPAYRNRGIATHALREALRVLAARGEAHALVTCAHDNAASIRTIEKCGGIRIADSMRRRYVIPTRAPAAVANAGLAIRPVREDDYTMLCDWFDDDDFVRWWGARAKPSHEVAEKYLGRRPGIRSYIIDQYGVPIGYLQDWQADAETIGIDIILVVPMQNRGIGTAALRDHAERLVAEGWRHIGIDPVPHNARAIRAFEKAGFRIEQQPREPDHLWMTYAGGEAP